MSRDLGGWGRWVGLLTLLVHAGTAQAAPTAGRERPILFSATLNAFGIFAVSPDNGQVHQLIGFSSSCPQLGSNPVWSPHSVRFAFAAASCDGLGQDVFTASPDGSQPAQLTHLAGDQVPFAWSPNGG